MLDELFRTPCIKHEKELEDLCVCVCVCVSVCLQVGTGLWGASCHFKYLQKQAKHWSIKHQSSLVESKEQPPSKKVLQSEYHLQRIGVHCSSVYIVNTPPFDHMKKSSGGSQDVKRYTSNFMFFLKIIIIISNSKYLTKIITLKLIAMPAWFVCFYFAFTFPLDCKISI